MAEEKKEAAPAEAKKKKSNRISSAKKRDLQSIKRNSQNRTFKAKVSTAITAYKKAVSDRLETGALKQKLSLVYSLMDKGVKTGIFKLNKANRTKSRLTSSKAAG